MAAGAGWWPAIGRGGGTKGGAAVGVNDDCMGDDTRRSISANEGVGLGGGGAGLRGLAA